MAKNNAEREVKEYKRNRLRQEELSILMSTFEMQGTDSEEDIELDTNDDEFKLSRDENQETKKEKNKEKSKTIC